MLIGIMLEENMAFMPWLPCMCDDFMMMDYARGKHGFVLSF